MNTLCSIYILIALKVYITTPVSICHKETFAINMNYYSKLYDKSGVENISSNIK